MNTAPGLLFGGIQNSKDFPICPYLLSTVWQYGDSEVGGWVYDPSLQVTSYAEAYFKILMPLQVTCPSHPCSVVKCGFRATCSVSGGEARCECRPGFQGDPYTRCYPRTQDSCSCRTLTVESRGPSSLHQRDKMGSFHLWGYYNEHPVYQHYSGLDFLYFHKNQVGFQLSPNLFLCICDFLFPPGLGDRTQGWGETSWSFEFLSCVLSLRDDLALAVWNQAARAGEAD